MSDPKRPHGLQPTRLLRPWDFPGKSTGVGCHCLLRCITRIAKIKLQRQRTASVDEDVKELKLSHTGGKNVKQSVLKNSPYSCPQEIYNLVWGESGDTKIVFEVIPSDKLDILDQLSSVQLLSRVRLFATPWTAAPQASLSITNSQSLLKLMSIKLVMPSNHLILCCPLPTFNLSQHQGLFK